MSYAELYELCETLDLIVNDDPGTMSAAYFYFTCLLTDLGASDLALQKLGYLEDWLAFMDPEEKGLFITDDGVSQTYTLGTRRCLPIPETPPANASPFACRTPTAMS